jgi:serine/threonine protein kinase
VEVRERFAREARAASRLNHPHICVVHDVGTQDGMDYLVMEYVEGETLAALLAKGPLPFDLALRYGIEVADALDKAHRQGVTHRDLKPSNIMVSAAGIKLLDFGLARLAAASPGGNEALSFSRITTDATNLTLRGSIVGTVQYMAPEQLEGIGADARTDIFAFGAVQYEMVCGRRPFDGRSHAALVSAILTHEPAKPSKLQSGIPLQFDHVISRCLAKNPDDRWQTAGDVMRELKWISQEPGVRFPFVSQMRLRKAYVWVAVMALLIAALALRGQFFRQAEPPEPVPMRLSVLPPTGENFAQSSGGSPWPALSPDGRQIVFGATFEGKPGLWLRSLDSDIPQPLAGTEDGIQPFWSPDGRFIAFFAGNRLKKLHIEGGKPETICEVPSNPREGSWNAADTIIFSVTGGPLYQVRPRAGRHSRLQHSMSRGPRLRTFIQASFPTDGISSFWLKARIPPRRPFRPALSTM